HASSTLAAPLRSRSPDVQALNRGATVAPPPEPSPHSVFRPPRQRPRWHAGWFLRWQIPPVRARFLRLGKPDATLCSVCFGGIFYSRRSLNAPSAAGAARSRAPPTLPAR